jgi:hypothetical protein
MFEKRPGQKGIMETVIDVDFDDKDDDSSIVRGGTCDNDGDKK